MEMFEIVRAEVKVDVYDGKNCDEHRKYFNIYTEGDKDSENSEEPLKFRLETLPAGAKIIVTVPCCSECDLPEEICDCGFDWKSWIEIQYS